MQTPRSVGTHDGSFHADEVTACALLVFYKLVDIDKIIRTREGSALAACEYVCDVGGLYDPASKRFDHHQVSYEGTLSSAGMILIYLQERGLLSGEEYEFFNASLVHGVDEQDNGRVFSPPGSCSFSDIIKFYNPLTSEDGDNTTEAFLEALYFTLGLLEKLHKRFIYNCESRAIVLGLMAKRDAPCMLFERVIPWMETFFSTGGEQHPALFVLFPGGIHWVLRGIPPSFERRMDVRVPFPEEWAGLLGDELKQITGISGAVFCHKGRFVSVWETKKDALAALEQTLKLQGVSHYDNSVRKDYKGGVIF
ncbi:MYG1 family protein [Candidatus Clavichlamydia salmonicola]|uniref:MYG1 family protein n=1 Tax=Candidatus Clavichlamydia salmonicola TaxID=469812 RepID=UPI001890C1C2|nr:MYG1 family protein [Candidatus Clavichlamydia salmonicola]